MGGLRCRPVSIGNERELSLKRKKVFMRLPETGKRKYGFDVLKGRNQLYHVHALAFLEGAVATLTGISPQALWPDSRHI